MTKSVSYRICAIILIAILLAAIIPLLLVARFDVACADDLSFGARAHSAYAASGSVLSAISAAFEEARIAYNTWQGSFSAIFLMALQPAVFGDGFYSITAWIMLLSLIGGVILFCVALFSRLFGASKSLSFCTAALVCIFSTQLLPSPVQGIFWYNGSVYYTLFFAVSLAALALGIRLLLNGGVWRELLLVILMLFIGGGNYVTALSTAIIGVCALILLTIRHDRRALRFIAPLIVLLASLVISVAAPGNAVRQSNYSSTPGVIEAILMSFKYGVIYSLEWLSLPVLGMLALMAVLFRRSAGMSRFRFKYPALVSLWSYCLLSAMFCPPVYAMGDTGDQRLHNIIYFAYLLLLTINLFYWSGWLAQHRGRVPDGSGASLLAASSAAFTLALCCVAAMFAGQSFTSVSALSSLRTGEAAEYYACAEVRFEILHDDSVSDAVLLEYPCQPYVLYYDDITQTPADWRNTAAAAFYGKDSVRLG